jgi:predicted DNA-binding protein (MmcQ/YjbR family)
VTRSELLSYCLAKPGAWPDEPWEDDVVAKVGPKIFAFLGSEAGHHGSATVGVKCGATREVADEWLARYPGDASVMAYIPDDELLEAIDASYDAVVAKLPKKDRPA